MNVVKSRIESNTQPASVAKLVRESDIQPVRVVFFTLLKEKDNDDKTDIDYLAQFIEAVESALVKRMNLEQSVDGLICDYFVQSILKTKDLDH